MVSVGKRILLLPGAHHSPSARFRILQYVTPLQQKGYSVTVRIPYPDRENKTRKGKVSILHRIHPLLAALARYITARWMLRDAGKFDYIISNRDIVPELSIKQLEQIAIKKSKFIFDFDDAIHLGKRGEKLAQFLPKTYHVFAGNETLAQFAKQFTPKVTILPTVVDTTKYSIRDNFSKDSFTIGWMGSAGTNKYLEMITEALKEVAKSHPISFLIVSNVNPQINIEGVNIIFEPWSASREVELLQKMDIGIMPLLDTEFERGKCGAKAIQYMAVGIPALVSPVGANRSIVDHSINGFHCNTVNDWTEKIEALITDKNMRTILGKNAAEKVSQFYSIDAVIDTWTNTLK